MANIQQWINAGLTNRDTEDYSVLATSGKMRPVAYCTSDKCIPKRRDKARKSVIGLPDNCPDCGHALFWKVERDPIESIL